MRPVRTLIAEDEKPARERLRLALLGFPEIEVVGEAVNGEQAAALIRELKPSLVFLDVQMPIMDGFEVLRCVDVPPAVVFTTAYDEYAVRAFEVHAVDYLLKPYGRERLRQAVDRALESLDRGRRSEGAELSALLEDVGRDRPYLTRVSARSGRSFRILPVDEAEFFKAENGLVFWVSGERSHLVDGSLGALTDRLDPARFFRAHRNAVVNLDRISAVAQLGRGRLAAEFPSGARIEIGRTRLDEFRRLMSLRG